MSAPIPANETQRLAALQRYRILDTAPEQAFDDFAILAATICKTPIATMTFLDGDRQWFKASVGVGIQETAREHSFCAHAILHEEVMEIEDAMRDERFAQNPYVTDHPRVRFYAGAPLIDREGMALGALCVMDSSPRLLTPEQSRALSALARQIILLLEYRQTSTQLAQALGDIRTLQGLLPICSHCKGIRDDAGFWRSVEEYVGAHADVDFSHGICPECLKEQYPEVYEMLYAKGQL